MLDTIKLRVHGINDEKRDIVSQVKATNKLTSKFAVPEHNDLYKAMLGFKGRNFSMSTFKNRTVMEISERDEDSFLLDENTSKIYQHEQIRNVMIFQDERKVKEVNMSINGNYRIPSSYNGVAFRINEAGGYIDFEFSIPKYLYGHSLAEFVPQIASSYYERNELKIHTWAWQQRHIYKRLNAFLDIFIEDICTHFKLEALLNKRYIEIRRLDLCFNQYFDSKAESLRYLDHLKKINYKRYKNNANAPVEYNTSLSYTSSEGAYFKIYHKGTEYSQSKHGDLKKHLAVNQKWIAKITKRMTAKQRKKHRWNVEFNKYNKVAKEHKKEWFELKSIFEDLGNGTLNPKEYPEHRVRFAKKLYQAMPYKIGFYKKEMDKVLRYEVSLSNSWFSYYYKHKIFRKDCDLHNASYIAFKQTKSDLDARNNGHKVNAVDMRNYKMMNKFLGRRAYLMLDTPFHIKHIWEKSGRNDYRPNTGVYRIQPSGIPNTMLEHNDVGTFGEDILKWAVKHFKKLVDYYQVHQLDPDDDLQTRINKYNDEVDDRVEMYNESNFYKIIRNDGKPYIKGRKVITKPVQLLTEKEKSDLGLKKIRPLIMITISDMMKKGFDKGIDDAKSLAQIRKDLKISPSQWTRYMRDLKKFGISYQTRVDLNPIETTKDWSKMYMNLGEYDFGRKFYVRNNQRYNE